MPNIRGFILTSVIAVIASTVTIWFVEHLRKRKNDTQTSSPERNWSIIVIIIAIFACIGCGAIGMLFGRNTVFSKSSLTPDDLVRSIYDMQNITLAISGISIAIISLVVGLLSLSREHQLEKYELELKKLIYESERRLSEELKKIDEIEQQHQDLNAINTLNTGFRYFPLREHLLLDRRKQEGSKMNILLSLMEFYITKAEHKSDYHEKAAAYKEAIIYAKELLRGAGGNMSGIYKQFALQRLISVHYDIAELTRNGDTDTSNANLLEAAKYIRSFDSIDNCELDEFGYLSNLTGLVYYWLYISDRSEYAAYLKMSEKAYRQAVKKYPANATFRRNLGVNLLHSAKGKPKTEQIERLEEVKKIFEEAAKHDPNDILSFVNIADINIRIIAVHLDIDMERHFLSLILPDYKSRSHNADDCEYIRSLVSEGEHYLAHAERINPKHINVHYKSGHLHTYGCFFDMATNSQDDQNRQRAESAFGRANAINPNHLSSLRCQRVFYELISDLSTAYEISRRATEIERKNTDAWKTNHKYQMYHQSTSAQR